MPTVQWNRVGARVSEEALLRARLVAVTKQWERMHKELRDELERLRALISWIDGQLVDEAPWMEIREGIYRAMEAKP